MTARPGWHVPCPLAVTTARRSGLLPDVPTLTEAGVPKFDASTTLGLVLPGKAAPELTTRLNQALDMVLHPPAVREQFARLVAEVKPGTQAEYATAGAPRGLYNDSCSLLTLYVYLRDHQADTLSRDEIAVEEATRMKKRATQV